MKTSVGLLLFMLTLSNVFAQQVEIYGTVTDSETGKALEKVKVKIKNSSTEVFTDAKGYYCLEARIGDFLEFFKEDYMPEREEVRSSGEINKVLFSINNQILIEADYEIREMSTGYRSMIKPVTWSPQSGGYDYNSMNRETYKEINSKGFQFVQTNPLSTLSINPDKAAYSNIRRMINLGQNIPKDAVKIEEMINYFNYDYPAPTGKHPFSINTEVADSPWNEGTKLVRIGLRGKDVNVESAPKSNLVFLIDVSGSMSPANRLPQLKESFKLLVDQLRPQDQVSIVVYASDTGIKLSPTHGSEKAAIKKAIDQLVASGSTSGYAGIQTAYKLAKESFIPGGNNRVILATDGDFNVGLSSERALEELIAKERESGVFLTVLGYGMGNYMDSKMETLAKAGNGNHYYIDNMQEARRVLGTEFFGTIYTIAKDVKIQVEFNPQYVQAHRLIGYENRMLEDRDFTDDKKDAGDLGSGHTLTAIYEVIPTGVKSPYLEHKPDLKYTHPQSQNISDEMMTVKLRYKETDSDKSKELEVSVKPDSKTIDKASADFKFAAAVAWFGLELRNSEYISKRNDTISIIRLAESGLANDSEGYRREFIRLVKIANNIN